ncbi:MAG: hypothetical protein IT261_00315 [Saprospiraceae bacterium]|nr:hypothetical protein [Saprospiraceae bacterium]
MKDKQGVILANAFFAKNKDTIPYHKSYLLAQQDNIADKIAQLRCTHPDLPLTKVVTSILNELPENMDSRLVRELTLFIIEAWEDIPADKLEKTFATK